MFEITARTNANHQTLSIDGEEFGGGPYQVCVNRAHAPVSVNKLPVWADGWPRVWIVLRAMLGAWEFNTDERQPKTPAEAIECARLLWRSAVKLARSGKPVTCWSILAAAYPTAYIVATLAASWWLITFTTLHTLFILLGLVLLLGLPAALKLQDTR
jgi:hypothetical protein